MYDVLSLTLPLFGLIVIGYAAGRLSAKPLEEMGWLNVFIIYVALPALFFKLLAKTPVDKLASWEFILTNLAVTFGIFFLTFVFGLIGTRFRVADSTIQGLAGAYGNIGYMGPALAILALGEQAAIPVALIFCFENVLHFFLAPALMAVSGRSDKGVVRLIWSVITSLLFHPFIMATTAGVAAAYFAFEPPKPVESLIAYLAQAAAPCALFAMGVTLAKRRLNRVPPALFYVVPMKLVLHPIAMFVALSYIGNFDRIWVLTAVLMAALPTATNVYVISQQYDVWSERASAAVLVSTALSVVTVSGLLFAIAGGHLPQDLFP